MTDQTDPKKTPVGIAQTDAATGQEVEVRLFGDPRKTRLSGRDQVRWSADDLDRCEHGRHSIDHCFDCVKPTNRFLMAPSTISVDERVRHHDGIWEVRIGTMVHGEPIWIVVRDAPRVNENKEANRDQ